jgi:hypothetical protein
MPNKKPSKHKEPETPAVVEETSTEKSLRAMAVAMNAFTTLVNEHIVPALEKIAEAAVITKGAVTDVAKTVVESPAPKRRITKETPVAAAPEAAKPEAPPPEEKKPKAEIVICKHIGSLEDVPGRPTLERCTTCGAVLDKAPEAAKPPAKPPAKEAVVEVGPPSIDDVRAVAINYAGKHGKEKLGKILADFGSQNISGVPKEKLAQLMAKLQEG